MGTVQDLVEFVERAKRNRKYPDATARTLIAAIRLYEAELNEDEQSSIQKINDNFDQITRSVFSKNQSRFNASSLTTYKSRMLKVLSDFEKYGDPVKMSNWNPRIVQRNIKGSSAGGKKKTQAEAEPFDEPRGTGRADVHRIEFALRENAKVLVVLPKDISAREIAKVKGIIDAMCAPEE